MKSKSRWLSAGLALLVSVGSLLALASPAEARTTTDENRAVFIRFDRHVFAKDLRTSFNGGWSEIDNSGSALKVEAGGNCLVMLTTGGGVFFKQINHIVQGTSYLGGWQQLIANGIADIAVGAIGNNYTESRQCLITALTTGGKVYARYNDSPAGVMYCQEDSGTVSQIAAGGQYMMIRRSDGAVFAKYDNIYYQCGGWTLEVDAGSSVSDIAIGADGYQMYVNSAEEVFARQGIGTTWTLEDSNGPVKDVAVGASVIYNGGVHAATQMMLYDNGQLWVRNGIGIGGWTLATDSVDQIDVSDSDFQISLTSDRKLWGKNYQDPQQCGYWGCLDDSQTIMLFSENTYNLTNYATIAVGRLGD